MGMLRRRFSPPGRPDFRYGIVSQFNHWGFEPWWLPRFINHHFSNLTGQESAVMVYEIEAQVAVAEAIANPGCVGLAIDVAGYGATALGGPAAGAFVFAVGFSYDIEYGDAEQGLSDAGVQLFAPLDAIDPARESTGLARRLKSYAEFADNIGQVSVIYSDVDCIYQRLT